MTANPFALSAEPAGPLPSRGRYNAQAIRDKYGMLKCSTYDLPQLERYAKHTDTAGEELCVISPWTVVELSRLQGAGTLAYERVTSGFPGTVKVQITDKGRAVLADWDGR